MAAYARMVGFDALLSVLRRAAPKLGKYGGDQGGDVDRMRRMLADDELLERVAREVTAADVAFEVKTKAAFQVIEAARKEHDDAISQIVRSLAATTAR